MKILAFLLCLTLCGCGPSAKQIADQQSQQQFKDAVAAVKVCTQGATYKEFRAKRLELETCYNANQAALTNESTAIQALLNLAHVTDIIWDPSNNNSEGTKAMRTIENLSGVSSKQFESENADFPNNYVRCGLALISKQCAELLTHPTPSPLR